MPIISNILIEPGTGAKIVAEPSTNGTTANTATVDTSTHSSISIHSHAITDIVNLQSTLDLKANDMHTHAYTDIIDFDNRITSKINSIVNLSGKANTSHTHILQDIIGLSNVARTGSYADLNNIPSFGSASSFNVPISGDALPSQIVLGTDSRLTDARIARPHDHDLTIGDGTSTRIMMKTSEQLNIVGGTNITLAFDDITNKITINSSGGATTDRLSTSRLIRVAGAVTGAVSFDGSSDVTINTTLTGSHNHAISEITGLQTALDTKITSAYFSTFGTSLAKALDDTEVKTLLGLGSIASRADSDFTPYSHIGTGGSAHALATSTSQGFLSSTDKVKIDSISSGATINSTDAQLRDRSTHTGTQTISTIAGLDAMLVSKSDSTHTHGLASSTSSGFLSVSDKNKLDSISSGATTNSTDAQLRDRSTHTGTQPASSITGLSTVAASGNYADLINKPAFGTAAFQNVASLGDASSSQIVLGNDTRLTDSRNPLSHSHTISIGDGSSPRISFGTNEAFHIVSGANVSMVYDDIANKLTISTSGTIVGNVDTATKLATARSIVLTGDVTGSGNFDGSSNISISTTIADDSHTHTIATITGLQAILDSKATGSVATTSLAGLMSATDKAKLDTLSNVSYTNASTTVAGLMSATDKIKLDGLTSYTGVTTTTAGLMLSSDKLKLDGIATGATANSTDAQLRDRSTHTGVQAISTITGLQSALDDKLSATQVLSYGDGTVSKITRPISDRLDFVAGSNIALVFDDITNKITISSTAQVSDSVDSASKLSTSRNISISGAVTGVVAFDGSTDVVINTTLSAHTHAEATISSAGFMSSADKVKLDSISTSATANSTDIQLRDRSTHTGTQAASTITGLATVATTGTYTDLLNKPTVLKFTESVTEPVNAINGDTWFNPDTGIKLTRISSTWAEL